MSDRLPTDMTKDVRRTRWKCRRGMLELDILLTQFYDRYFFYFSKQDQQLFAALLDQTDAWLYDRLIYEIEDLNSPYHALLLKIKLMVANP